MSFTRPESTNYHSYLLRIWRDGPQRPWRLSMHCAATDTLHYFADTNHLVAFLQAQTDDMEELASNEPE